MPDSMPDDEMDEESRRRRKRLLRRVCLGVFIPIACVAFASVYRLVEIKRMVAAVAAARTAQEEAAALRSVKEAGRGLSALLFGGYQVRLFDQGERPLDRAQLENFQAVRFAEIEWRNGTKVRRRLIVPANAAKLLED